MDPSATSQPADRFRFYAGVARNTVYLTTAIGVTSGALFACDVLLARTLTKDEYGLIVYVMGFIWFALYLSDLGLSRWLPATLAQALGRGDTASANRILGHALILQTAAGWLLAGLIVGISFYVPEVARLLKDWLGAGSPVEGSEIPHYVGPWLRVLALWLVTLPFVRLLEGVYDGHQEMGYSLLAAVLREPVRMVAIAGVVLVTHNVGWAVMAIALSSVVILALNLILYKRFQRRAAGCRFVLDRNGLGETFHASMYFFLPLVGLLMFPELVRLIAGSFDSPVVAGKLKICMSLTLLAFIPIGALARAILPAFGSKSQDRLILRASFLGSLKLAGVINFVFFVGLAAAGAYAVRVIFGAAYPVEEMHGLMVLVALASFYEGFRLLTEPLLQGTGHARVFGYIEALRLVAIVVLGFVLVPRWPEEGIAVALCAVNLLAWALRFAAVQHHVVRVPWVAMTGLALLATAMAVAAMYGWTAIFWILTAATLLLQALTFTRADVAALRNTFGILLQGLRPGKQPGE